MSKKIEHLYVHIPFCTRICPYCGFYKHKLSGTTLKPFVVALRKELVNARRNFDLKLKTIYFGGGTPSALSLPLLQHVFQGLPWWHHVEEFTFECNPATLSLEKIKFLRKLGVNRISLGIQSFDDNFLQLLGRTHRRKDILDTLQRIRDCGFENINFDLMFGLPEQTLSQWQNTLEDAIALNPQHISAYSLNFEEGTEFLQRLQSDEWKIDENLHKEMFLLSHEFLEKNGFEHYEISNFAPKKYQSLHNLAYWEGKDYLGIGPSACSTLGETRYENIADTLAYIESMQKNSIPSRTEEMLSPQTKLSEKIFLGLRTKQGVEMNLLSPWKKEVADLLQNNLAQIQNNRLSLTPTGLLVADEISQIFI